MIIIIIHHSLFIIKSKTLYREHSKIWWPEFVFLLLRTPRAFNFFLSLSFSFGDNKNSFESFFASDGFFIIIIIICFLLHLLSFILSNWKRGRERERIIFGISGEWIIRQRFKQNIIRVHHDFYISPLFCSVEYI